MLRRWRVTGIRLVAGGPVIVPAPCRARVEGRGRVVEPVARILPPMRRPSYRAVALGLILMLSMAGGAAGETGSVRAAIGRSGSSPAAAPRSTRPRRATSRSAAITAQLFESLTTFDADLQLRPALAESWRVDEDGTRVVFHLRPDLIVLRRHAAAGVRRRAQLAPPDRPVGTVAAGLARCSTWRAPPSTSGRDVGGVGRGAARR